MAEQQAVHLVGGIEHRFASGFDIAKPQTMVYIDFYQQNPRQQGEGEYVAQVVMLPELARLLAEKLSELRTD
jgi:hypothetical protein